MKRVLIVDDSMELGRWLQTALVQSNPSVDARLVPSGEEALLESTRMPPDVLVTDVRLPGMNGFELVRKMRKRLPGVRVIIITGLQDPSLKKQAEDEGADAFFIKPMDIPSFLQAVSSCLQSLPDAEPQPQVPEKALEPAPQRTIPVHYDELAALVNGLRQELGALAVFLISQRGKVLVQSGQFLESVFEETWVPVLLAVQKAAGQVSNLLEVQSARNLMTFQGMAFDLILSPVDGYILVLIMRTGRPMMRLAVAFEEINVVQKKLLAVLDRADSQPQPQPEPVHFEPEVQPKPKPSAPRPAVETPRPEPTEPPKSTIATGELDRLLQAADGIKTQDADAFWDAFADEPPVKSANADALSYEQARKMGLAPDFEEKKP